MASSSAHACAPGWSWALRLEECCLRTQTDKHDVPIYTYKYLHTSLRVEHKKCRGHFLSCVVLSKDVNKRSVFPWIERNWVVLRRIVSCALVFFVLFARVRRHTYRSVSDACKENVFIWHSSDGALFSPQPIASLLEWRQRHAHLRNENGIWGNCRIDKVWKRADVFFSYSITFTSLLLGLLYYVWYFITVSTDLVINALKWNKRKKKRKMRGTCINEALFCSMVLLLWEHLFETTKRRDFSTNKLNHIFLQSGISRVSRICMQY